MTSVQSEGRNPSRRKKRKPNTIRVLEETPTKYTGAVYPTNLLQQKERFLQYGILPQFILRGSQSQLDVIANKPVGRISSQYLQQAVTILQLVKDKFKSGDEYFQQAFGDRIDINTASSCLTQYLNENGLDGHINIVFSSDLDCSARMMWHGPNVKRNKPEARRHTLIIKNSPDNFYLRQQGIICLANHEIGTHYIRTLNDGLQPWYADRKMFGLRSTRGYHFRKTEEGLAALNTILQAKCRYLYGPALLYYIACMAEKMTFKELFHHLEEFVKDPEKRWHYVMRVKRHLPDPNDLGGLGKDQCYFEGAMEILTDLENFELPLIYSGTICSDETSRIKRISRLDCLKLPRFLDDIEYYRHQLRWIGYVNGILPKPAPRRIKNKKGQNKLLAQGPSPGGRENGSRGSSRHNSKQSTEKPEYSLTDVPSNMVLIHDDSKSKTSEQPSRSSSADQKEEDSEIRPMTPTEPTSPTPPQPSGAYSCILEKISSRLTFHDDLIKRVESRLTTATLSLKQSEKLMLNGVQGKSGLIAETSPLLCAQSPIPSISNGATGNHSNVPLWEASSSSGYSSSSSIFSDGDLLKEKDKGNFSVQSRPPTQHAMDTPARSVSRLSSERSLLSSLVERELNNIGKPPIPHRKRAKTPLLARRNKSNS